MAGVVGGLPRLLWLPGAAKRAVLDAERRIHESGFVRPNGEFFQRLADQAEEYARCEFEDIDLGDPTQDIHLERRLVYINRLAAHGPDDMVLAAELSETPAQTMLGSWLCLFGTDGYNELILETAWNSRPDPPWGTLFCPQIPIGDCRPDFVFKVCRDGKYRVLAVECDALPKGAGQLICGDRRLVANGVLVMRFTDAEIARDTSACVDEISSALSELVDALLAETGDMRGGPTRWLKESMTPVGKRLRPK